MPVLVVSPRPSWHRFSPGCRGPRCPGVGDPAGVFQLAHQPLPQLPPPHRRGQRPTVGDGGDGFAQRGVDSGHRLRAVVQLAMELTAWMQLLALSGTDGRRWEPKRLRLRLLWIAGKLARKSRKTWLMLSSDAPWISMFTDAMTRLQTRSAPT
jgi:DDE family transposase